MAERWLLCVRDEMAYSAIRAHMNPDGFGLFPALLQRAPPLARPNNTGPHNNRAVLARGPDPSSHIPDLAKMLAHHVAMTFSSRRIRRLHGGSLAVGFDDSMAVSRCRSHRASFSERNGRRCALLPWSSGGSGLAGTKVITKCLCLRGSSLERPGGVPLGMDPDDRRCDRRLTTSAPKPDSSSSCSRHGRDRRGPPLDPGIDIPDGARRGQRKTQVWYAEPDRRLQAAKILHRWDRGSGITKPPTRLSNERPGAPGTAG